MERGVYLKEIIKFSSMQILENFMDTTSIFFLLNASFCIYNFLQTFVKKNEICEKSKMQGKKRI